MTAAVVVDLASSPWIGTDRGATPEAMSIPRKVTAIRESLMELAEAGRLRRAAREALSDAYRECSVHDWDGYGADPADHFSASWADKIVASLLPILALPHYSFDPDGDALLEWYWSADRVLDMSIGSDGEIRYAATIGGAKVTGIEEYSDGLPPRLLDVARRLAA